MMKKVLVMVMAAVFVFASMVFAEGKQVKKGCPGMEMGMGMQGKDCGMGKCPMCGPDREVKVTDTKDGVQIVITSKNAGTVKEIQTQAKACLEMKCKMKTGTDAAAASNKEVRESTADGKNDEIVQCPVTGEKFPKNKAFKVYEYKGKKYYMCCPMCVEPFTTNPEKYIKK
jgi:YHS domain-containing protein